MIDIFLSFFRKRYNLSDVFTPASAARLTFVPRPIIEKNFEKFLEIPGMQIVVYGHSGGGKTTLIVNKLGKLKLNYIISSCISNTTINDLILQAFDQLNLYYTSEKVKKSSIKISAQMKANYRAIESSLKSESNEQYEVKQIRVLPVQLTPNRLAEFFGEANCLWIIEDFHKVDDSEKTKLSQIMKVFHDTANKYKNVKVIAVGAKGTAREVVNYDKELSDRVAEIYIPLLTDDDLHKIIEAGSNLLNTEMGLSVSEKIVKNSNHLAAICHQLCFNMCYEQSVFRTLRQIRRLGKDDLNNAVKSYIQQKSDTFQKIYDQAVRQKKGKFENVKLIFKALIDLEKEQVAYNEIFTQIKNYERRYPASNLTAYLKPLTTTEYNEILRFDSDSGKYSFSNPFFKAYVMLVLETDENDVTLKGKFKSGDHWEQILKLVLKFIESKQ